MKLHRLLHTSVLAIAMLVFVPSSAFARSKAEQKLEDQLVAKAETQLNVLLVSTNKKSARIKALYALERIRARMKVLADADPNFTQRSTTQPFRNVYETLGPGLEAEAKELGVDLSEPQSAATAARGACTPSTTPQALDYSRPATVAPYSRALRRAYANLSKELDQPPADQVLEPGGRADQRAKRDELLRKYILAQIAYVWAVAGDPSGWSDLLHESHGYSQAVHNLHVADTEDLKLMAQLAALHATWDKVKHMLVVGKTIPALSLIHFAAQKTNKHIKRNWERFNASYQKYLTAMWPVQEKAAAMFKSQMKNGLMEINYYLGAGKNKEQKFTLFRPTAPHDRDLLNRAIGAWIMKQLHLHGTLKGVQWVDWNDFKDFDFKAKGLAPGSNCPPKVVGRQSPVPPKEHPPKKKVACHGGGLAGAVNCGVTAKIPR